MMTLTLIALVVSASPDFVELPDAGSVGIDYMAFDSTNGRLWVPSGGTARIDVIDVKTRSVQSIAGQPTAAHGEHLSGVSSASVGDGVVFVGNRANATLCRFDSKSLEAKGCVTLSSAPDGVLWVPTTKEVWVTLPEINSLAVVSVSADRLAVAATLKLEGSPEGYAFDAKHGVFFTNLEDGNRTLGFEVRTRKLKTTWAVDCGERGPRGLAVDVERDQVFVACTNGLRVLHGGAIVSKLDLGEGIDNIDYDAKTHSVLVASGKSATLSVVEVSAKGQATIKATYPTAPGCRTVVLSPGLAWLPDSRGHRVVVQSLAK